MNNIKKKLSEGAGGGLKKAAAGKKFRLCFFTAAARPAAVTVWNIFRIILRSRFSILIRTIYPEEEYRKRVEEQKRLARELPARYPIHVIEGIYERSSFMRQ